MSFDLAIDYNTGDLLMSPNNDIQGRTGSDVYEQRIRIRLKVPHGSWELDPSGELGSRLLELTRVPVSRAILDVDQYVREALEPMDDITVENIESSIPDDSIHSIDLQITYLPSTDEGAAIAQIANVSVTSPIV